MSKLENAKLTEILKAVHISLEAQILEFYILEAAVTTEDYMVLVFVRFGQNHQRIVYASPTEWKGLSLNELTTLFRNKIVNSLPAITSKMSH